MPKIVFFASNIADVKTDLRPKIERILAEKNISSDAILEYHTEAEENAEDFRQLDTAESKKQFILLVGKGTEGWNCRSLVSVALYKKPKSTILVLQSTTRCLRAIGDNSTKARIFLSKENYKILDANNNFNYVQLSLTVGAAATLVSADVWGVYPRFEPVTQPVAVAQVV